MRIAWFTPFNDRSAIAEFSAQIALALSMTADVEIWTNEISPMSSSIPTINYRHAQPNLDTLNQYDIAVYNFGNYLAYHDTIYEVSKQRRGLVILHDRVMQHFFAGYHFVKQRNPQAYLDMMRRFYGWKGYLRAKAGVDGNKPGIWDDDLEVGRYPLFEECIVNAEGVVVHSSSQARLVRDGWCGPVRALHFPSYAGNLAAAPDPGVRATNRERLTILTIGHGNRNKRIHEVIRVLGEDQALARRSRYVVIGPIESSYRAELMHLIDRYSLADSVDLMGYQPDDILRRYVAMSDVFVNLRLPSMEGGSASLMLEMAAGGPVIVYDVGVFAELPEGTVIKVNPSAPEGLHVALDRLLSSADLRVKVGTAARAFAVKWNEKRYAQEFLSFIDEVKSWRPLLTLSDTVAGHIRSVNKWTLVIRWLEKYVVCFRRR